MSSWSYLFDYIQGQYLSAGAEAALSASPTVIVPAIVAGAVEPMVAMDIKSIHVIFSFDD
jgi:hypothetical protein